MAFSRLLFSRLLGLVICFTLTALVSTRQAQAQTVARQWNEAPLRCDSHRFSRSYGALEESLSHVGRDV